MTSISGVNRIQLGAAKHGSKPAAISGEKLEANQSPIVSDRTSIGIGALEIVPNPASSSPEERVVPSKNQVHRYNFSSAGELLSLVTQKASQTWLADYGEVLQKVALVQPKTTSPAEFAALASEQIPLDGLDREEKITGLYRGIVASLTPQNQLAQFAHKLGTARLSPEEYALSSGQSELALYKAALRPEQSSREFSQTVKDQVNREDQKILVRHLLRDLFPERNKAVQKLMAFAPRKAKVGLDLLSSIALSAESYLGPQSLAEQALLQPESPQEVLEMSAKNFAQSDSRAKFLVNLAEQRRSDDELRFEPEARKTLFRASLDPTMSHHDIAQRVSNPSLKRALHGQTNFEQNEPPLSESNPSLLYSEIPADGNQTPEPDSQIFSSPNLPHALTKYSPPETVSRHRQILTQALQKQPKIAGPFELMKEVEALLPEGRHKNGIVKEISIAVAKALAPESANVRFTLRLLDSDKIRTSATQKALLRAAFKEAQESSFLETVFTDKDLPEQDKNFIKKELLLEYFPDRATNIEKVLHLSGPEKKSIHSSLLVEAALAAETQESPQSLAVRAAEIADNQWGDEADVNAAELYRSAAQIQAKGDSRAQFLLELAASRRDNGTPEIEEADNLSTVYKGALNTELSNQELMKQICDDCRGDDVSRFLKREMGQQFFPAQYQAALEISQYVYEDEKTRVQDKLFQLFLDSPESLTKENILLDKVSALHSSQRDPIRQALVKKQGDSNPRGQFVLEFLQDNPSTFRDDSVNALFEGALDKNLSDASFVKQVAEDGGFGDRDRLRYALGQEFFPEEVQFIDELTKESAFRDREKHWQRLFDAAIEMPGTRDIPRLVLKAGESFNGAFSTQRSELSLYKMALGKLAEKTPRAQLATNILSSEDGLSWTSSEIALAKASLSPSSDVDFLMEACTGAHENDQAKLTKAIGKWLLSNPELNTPQETLDQLERGELTAPELKEVIEALRVGSGPSHNDTEIEVEDDILIIGDEELEVDIL